jgi:hypothetical protein
MVAAVALIDWRVGFDISLGAFYVAPMALAALVLSRIQIFWVSIVCALLKLAFNPACQRHFPTPEA